MHENMERSHGEVERMVVKNNYMDIKQIKKEMKKLIERAYELGRKEAYSDALRNANNYKKERGLC